MRATLLSLVILTSLAGPAAAEDRFWSDWLEDGEQVLQHGPEQLDNLALDFRCKEGSGRVTLELPVAANWKAGHVILRSGSATTTLAARLEKDGETIDGWAVGEVLVRDPVLIAFVATGRLSIDGVGPINATYPAERTSIARFFRICDQR